MFEDYDDAKEVLGKHFNSKRMRRIEKALQVYVASLMFLHLPMIVSLNYTHFVDGLYEKNDS